MNSVCICVCDGFSSCITGVSGQQESSSVVHWKLHSACVCRGVYALEKGLSVCSLRSAWQRAGLCAYVFSSPWVCMLQAYACVAFTDAMDQILS